MRTRRDMHTHGVEQITKNAIFLFQKLCLQQTEKSLRAIMGVSETLMDNTVTAVNAELAVSECLMMNEY